MGNKVKKMLKHGFVSEKSNKRWVSVCESFYIFENMRFHVGLFTKNGKTPDSNLDKYILADFNARSFKSEEEFRTYINNRFDHIVDYIREKNPEYEILIKRNEINIDINSMLKHVEYYYKWP